MEAASPPKRMTRARAAAKGAAATTTTPNTKTTTTTTATKPKPTKTAVAPSKTTAATRTTSTKRKTRSDEVEDEEQSKDTEQHSTMNKPARTRGRAKKVVEPEPAPAPEPDHETEPEVDDAPAPIVKATRGRPKKTTTAVAPKLETAAKATRTRTRKTTTTTEDADADTSAEPVKKTTRRRAAPNAKAAPGTVTTTFSTEPTPGLKSAVSRPASRIGGVTKKSVSFQEPEKENVQPAKKAKTKATETATGMRAKPVRKPAASGRTTRASARAGTPEEKKDKSPLSPKKDGSNLPLSKDASSDDELATYEKTPLKPLMKSPVKPPTGVKKLDLQPRTKEGEEDTQQAQEPPAPFVFGSPARRPPASPFKDMMKSPAKRVDAVPSLVLPPTNSDDQTTQSPFKASMLQSPAKRPQLPIKALQPPAQDQPGPSRSPVKMSLFQSPAKRPMSPFKALGSAVQTSGDERKQLFGDKSSPVKETAPIQETQPSEATVEPSAEGVNDELATSEDQKGGEGVELESPTQLTFPGRLSAVLPRHADPALRKNPLPVQELVLEQTATVITEPVQTQDEPVIAKVEELADDPMDVDEIETVGQDAPSPAQTTPPQSPPQRALHPDFGLRAKDLDDQYMSESEDELSASSGKMLSKYQDNTTLTCGGVPATPTPAPLKNSRGSLPSSAIKAANRAIRSVSKSSKLGITPLAMQLSEWKASSPLKLGRPEQVSATEASNEEGYSLLEDKGFPAVDRTPSKGFFDDEMRIRADMENQAAMEAALEADIAARFDEPEFDDIDITNEDVELAVEADEMSHLEPEQVDELIDTRGHDDSISDGSQEYGDENAVPIDPALLSNRAGGRSQSLAPVTPSRPSAAKGFHTVSKVPLKPADDSTPRSMKKRSASASKFPVNRPSGLSRNASVISYSPTKESSRMEVDDKEQESEMPPTTPSKSDIWSSMGTPARTPRRDLNSSLLRGAVVFVDVHTSEGADASTVFVELLSQMGARCVKSWPWNPTSPTNGESSTSKVGITHVVYKDGGKRTMEKVKQTGGVVQCVGVGWVLDCERENEWLDEAPYYIDTSLIPRGGRNRRKSMEPKALANLNGTLVTPMRPNATPARDCQTVPNNHMSRRDSTVWVRTPSDHDEDEDAPSEQDWNDEIGMLTPVPKTPAPEAIAKFAMDVTPETPGEGSYEDYSSEEQLLMRTCPPKQIAFADMGQGVLRQEKDQSVLMRLMAARRKSLQFAPKIASPLSKAWK